MQKTLLTGNLGKDPELRDANGTPVCSFSVATSERWKDREGNKQEKTEWHKIVAWGDLANICADYLKKGTKVYIEGRNRTRKWTDQNGVERYITEIHAKEMEILTFAQNGNGGQDGNNPPPPNNDGNPPLNINDVPF